MRSKMNGRAAGLLVVVALLAGCAFDPARLPVGTPRADALASLGNPTATFPLPNGGERLQYSRAPMGYEVTNVDVDGSGRVARVRQELDERWFADTIQTDQWRVPDILRTYGPPYEIDRVASFQGDVWSWRFMNINNRRMLYIYVDPQGVVRRWHTGDDIRYDLRLR